MASAQDFLPWSVYFATFLKQLVFGIKSSLPKVSLIGGRNLFYQTVILKNPVES